MHKATGPDAISTTILKATNDMITPILQIIKFSDLSGHWKSNQHADWTATLVTSCSLQ